MRSLFFSAALLSTVVLAGCSQNKVELDKAATVAWDKTRDGDPTVPKLGGGAAGGAMSGKGKFGSKPAGAAAPATTPPSTPPK